MLNALDKDLLAKIAGLHEIPAGAYNIRKNGEGTGRKTTSNIDIVTKADKPGIDVIIKPGTKNESVHIPVIMSSGGITDVVYNTFDIGAGSDVLIVAGCGIHNPGKNDSRHDGVHEFFVRKGARMRYVEKHYAQGQGGGEKIMNPKTILYVEEGGICELEMVQIKGVDRSDRRTEVHLAADARLVLTERLLTDSSQNAVSGITVELEGENSTAQVISRSVARDYSVQKFLFHLIGKNNCRGHVQCDSIIMDHASVLSVPEISALHRDAQLVHEAAIGKIASDQLTKLMSLGLSDKEAEDTILRGFLR
jgi:Fe-S cluster assembly scaffold protein SufB